MTAPPSTAFVLGGGLLGASHVGMLRALFEDGIRPDVVLGTSVGDDIPDVPGHYYSSN